MDVSSFTARIIGGQQRKVPDTVTYAVHPIVSAKIHDRLQKHIAKRSDVRGELMTSLRHQTRKIVSWFPHASVVVHVLRSIDWNKQPSWQDAQVAGKLITAHQK